MIKYSKIIVDETPYCFWDWELQDENLAFIGEIDPTYFEFIAQNNSKILAEEERQYAAIALRMAYSQGLEAFFALLCATVQAPDCIMGWILKYRDLTSIVDKIHNRQPVKTKLRINSVTWESLSNTINLFPDEDDEKEQQIKKSFAKLWHNFAKDFLDENNQNEYNSIKHGLRIRPGGSQLAIGREDIPGMPAKPEQMHSLSKSDFGSQFFTAKNIDNVKHHCQIERHWRNWDPENFIHGLNLISLSMKNVISFLKFGHGIRPVNFLYFYEEDLYKKPWEKSVGLPGFSYKSTIHPEEIKFFDKSEILSEYASNT